jgi:hypothetical protein
MTSENKEVVGGFLVSIARWSKPPHHVKVNPLGEETPPKGWGWSDPPISTSYRLIRPMNDPKRCHGEKGPEPAK